MNLKELMITFSIMLIVVSVVLVFAPFWNDCEDCILSDSAEENEANIEMFINNL